MKSQCSGYFFFIFLGGLVGWLVHWLVGLFVFFKPLNEFAKSIRSWFSAVDFLHFIMQGLEWSPMRFNNASV